MDIMDKSKFADKIKLLADTFRARLQPRTIEGYWEALRGYPWSILERAMEKALIGTSFPAPGTLAEMSANVTAEAGRAVQYHPGPRAMKVTGAFLRELMEFLPNDWESAGPNPKRRQALEDFRRTRIPVLQAEFREAERLDQGGAPRPAQDDFRNRFDNPNLRYPDGAPVPDEVPF